MNTKISSRIYKNEKLNTFYFRITYYDETDKRRYIKKEGYKQRKEALKECDRIINELEEIGNVDVLRFHTLAEEYFEWYSARRKASSIKSLKTHLDNHLLPYFRNYDVYKLDTKAIMNFQTKKLKEGHSGEYLKKMHVFLSAILKHGMKYHNLKSNVAALVGNFEIESNKRLRYWTLEQFNEFIAFSKNVQQEVFFKLLFYTGARKGEIRALCWDDINWQEKYISITKTDYHGIVTTPKTKAANRDIYLPDHMMKDLKRLNEWYKENKIYKSKYRIFGEFLDAYSESTIDMWFKNHLKRIDDSLPEGETFPRIVIHEFRHSHASYLINKSANYQQIAQRLGHADITEVVNRYGHLYPESQKELANLL